MTADILVVNAGSSSLKYALVDPATGERSIAGLVERIGEPGSDVPDHTAAFAALQGRLQGAGARPRSIGHRVVHGGERFSEPVLLDADVRAAIADCIPLAPLHNPPALAGIDAAMAAFPAAPQVAVFDTAFHTTIPAAARTYAIDQDIAERYRLVRYGFHGTSHQFVAQRAAQVLQRPLADLNLITVHAGNGASVCAVAGGRSVETSMGVTPLEGLVMGTRSGDCDPAIPLILLRAGMSATQVDDLLNRQSGLQGLCGTNDMREVAQRAAAGDSAAQLAREVAIHRIRKYLGAYAVTLGSLDAVIFTAGIGEHDADLRAGVCRDLGLLGIDIDPAANADPREPVISTAASRVAVMVISTDEEWAIAGQVAATTDGG